MIRNTSKNRILASKTRLIRSLLGKSIGLMLQERVLDEGVVFIFNMENNRSFHTMFMLFSLDFLFLDSKKRVIKVVRNVRPWRLFVTGKAMYVIELSAGRSLNTEVGDVISFK